MKKVIVAGALVLESVYPIPTAQESATTRAGRRALSSEAQQRMNLKYAWQKLELELAANFSVGDLYCTLTYAEAHLPSSRAAATRRIQGFWKKLRAARGKAALRYLYVTEGKHGNGRLHHHALIKATGDDFALIQKLWRFGSVDFVSLRLDREKNYESLARYLCKEQREKLGQRLWSGSRNLEKPEVESYRVEEDVSLTPPPGALVLDDSGDRVTQYGHYRYLKFLAPHWERGMPVKPKRRPRKAR